MPLNQAGPDVHLLQSLMPMWEEEKERCAYACMHLDSSVHVWQEETEGV